MSGTRTPAALVTGASGGIGGAVARQLVDAGWSVLCQRHRGQGEDLGAGADWVSADLSTRAGTDTVEAAVRSRSAAGGLDLLVYCAGRLPRSEDSWQDALDVFALHVVSLRRLVVGLRDELAATSGCVALVSSSSADRATPGQGIYGATKAAGEALVCSLGYELGPSGIRVFGVRPSVVATPMSRAALADPEDARRFAANSALKRLAGADDIARFIVLLSSREAAWLTGRTVWADGGSTLGWGA